MVQTAYHWLLYLPTNVQIMSGVESRPGTGPTKKEAYRSIPPPPSLLSFLILVGGGGRRKGAYENLCDSLGIPGMVSLLGPDTPDQLPSRPPFYFYTSTTTLSLLYSIQQRGRMNKYFLTFCKIIRFLPDVRQDDHVSSWHSARWSGFFLTFFKMIRRPPDILQDDQVSSRHSARWSGFFLTFCQMIRFLPDILQDDQVSSWHSARWSGFFQTFWKVHYLSLSIC